MARMARVTQAEVEIFHPRYPPTPGVLLHAVVRGPASRVALRLRRHGSSKRPAAPTPRTFGSLRAEQVYPTADRSSVLSNAIEVLHTVFGPDEPGHLRLGSGFTCWMPAVAHFARGPRTKSRNRSRASGTIGDPQRLTVLFKTSEADDQDFLWESCTREASLRLFG